MNANRKMSSNQHIGQTMVGLQGKITGARVMVCLFDPSEIGIIKYRVCI